jgi:hypothetical protein
MQKIAVSIVLPLKLIMNPPLAEKPGDEEGIPNQNILFQ